MILKIGLRNFCQGSQNQQYSTRWHVFDGIKHITFGGSTVPVTSIPLAQPGPDSIVIEREVLLCERGPENVQVWVALLDVHGPEGLRKLAVDVDGVAYLCNDRGDTIEKILP